MGIKVGVNGVAREVPSIRCCYYGTAEDIRYIGAQVNGALRTCFGTPPIQPDITTFTLEWISDEDRYLDVFLPDESSTSIPSGTSDIFDVTVGNLIKVDSTRVTRWDVKGEYNCSFANCTITIEGPTPTMTLHGVGR